MSKFFCRQRQKASSKEVASSWNTRSNEYVFGAEASAVRDQGPCLGLAGDLGVKKLYEPNELKAAVIE